MSEQPTKAQHHRWSEPVHFAQKTERECMLGCRIIRVTMHPDGRGGRAHWKEFWRDGEKIASGQTPACEPVEIETSSTTEALVCP